MAIGKDCVLLPRWAARRVGSSHCEKAPYIRMVLHVYKRREVDRIDFVVADVRYCMWAILPNETAHRIP